MTTSRKRNLIDLADRCESRAKYLLEGALESGLTTEHSERVGWAQSAQHLLSCAAMLRERARMETPAPKGPML